MLHHLPAWCRNTNGSIGPGSITVTSPDYDADVAVRWIPENSTALFSVRGTVTTQDWIQDFKQVTQVVVSGLQSGRHLLCTSRRGSSSVRAGTDRCAPGLGESAV